MRVLIVDDDLATRKLLGVRLRSWGYEPVLASNGEEAWSLIQSSPVPLVISDWNMPLLDGVQLCRLFTSVRDLACKLIRHIRAYSKTARPFRWKYSDLRRRMPAC